jgi:CHAT domain-containing protein/Tfp pilus assembly protein PilF
MPLLLVGLAASISYSDETTWKQQMQAATAAYQDGNFDSAENHLKASIEEAEKFNPKDERLAISLYHLAILYRNQDRKDEHGVPKSRLLFQRALGIWEDLANEYLKNYNYSQAERLYNQIIEIREKLFGLDSVYLSTFLTNLAIIYRQQDNYEKAEPIFRRALVIRENKLGNKHESVTKILIDLAMLYEDQLRYSEALPLHLRALAIFEGIYGSDHQKVAQELSNIAMLKIAEKQYTDAEQLFYRTMKIYDKAHDNKEVAETLDRLALMYQIQGRYANASQIYEKALSIKKNVYGPNHPEIAKSLTNIGILCKIALCDDNQEELLKFQETIFLKALNIFKMEGESILIAYGLDNLAKVYLDQKRYADAEKNYNDALAIMKKIYGENSLFVAKSLFNLANVYFEKHQYSEAESLYLHTLSIYNTALGAKHHEQIMVLEMLSILYNRQGRIDDALNTIRQAVLIKRKQTQSLIGLADPTEVIIEQRRQTPTYQVQADILTDAIVCQPDLTASLQDELFETVQLSRTSETSLALANMATRFAAGNDELADLVRKRQDSMTRLTVRRRQFSKAISEPTERQNPERMDQLSKEIKAIETQLGIDDTDLQQRYPKYSELSNPKPISIKETQSLLDPDEALISYLVGKKASYLWVIRNKEAHFISLAIDKLNLDKQIQALRYYLDPTQCKKECDYPTQNAHALYNKLFAPSKPFLQGVTYVMLIPDGSLQRLPFDVLLSEQPATAKSTEYRNMAWLVRDYAFSVLPSESSFRALRLFAKAEAGKDPFVGFGNPLNIPKNSDLVELPKTAEELKQIADKLGAPKHSVYLGEAATETAVKSIDLSRYRVIEFATHALKASELQKNAGIADPALVLTKPAHGSENDDGWLTASEVTQLKLNADWVILSACNTASSSSDAPESEGFSGLTKAFFYAGSRALLVSHWYVEDESTIKLTTGIFNILSNNSAFSKAQSVQKSKLKLMEEHVFSHPKYWAPFVLVGDGKR